MRQTVHGPASRSSSRAAPEEAEEQQQERGCGTHICERPPPHSHLPGNSLAEASFSSLLSVCLAVSCECVLDFYQPSKQLASYTGKNI